MRSRRNHEGYWDPTARLALRRAAKRPRKPKGKNRLMYPIREARGFLVVVEILTMK